MIFSQPTFNIFYPYIESNEMRKKNHFTFYAIWNAFKVSTIKSQRTQNLFLPTFCKDFEKNLKMNEWINKWINKWMI